MASRVAGNNIHTQNEKVVLVGMDEAYGAERQRVKQRQNPTRLAPYGQLTFDSIASPWDNFDVGSSSRWCIGWLCAAAVLFFDNLPTHAATLHRETTSYAIWSQYPTEKVFPTAAVPTNLENTVSLSAARGEIESFQLVITPTTDWSAVTIQFTDLIGPTTIASNQMDFLRVWYVNVTSLSLNDDGTYGQLGWNPDPLPHENLSDIVLTNMETGGPHGVFLVRIRIPEMAEPGAYTGSLRVLRDGELVDSVGIELTIYPFSIKKRHLLWHTLTKNQEPDLWDFAGFDELIAEHRGSVANFPAIEKQVNATTGEVNILDTTAFDAEVEKYVKEYSMGVFRFPDAGWFGSNHAWKPGASWNGIVVFLDEENNTINPVFSAAYENYFSQMAQHLREKQWLDLFEAKIVDEFTKDNDIDKARLVFDIISQADADILIQWTGNPDPAKQALLPYIGRWIVHDDFWSTGLTTELKSMGAEVWCYNNSRPLIDFHFMRVRSFAWSLWNRKLHGELRWSINSWPVNSVTGVHDGGWETLDSGLRRMGSSYLVYEPRVDLEKPAVSSLRFELYRESFEDAEYLWLLDTCIREAVLAGIDTTSAEAAYAKRLLIAPLDETSNVFSPADAPYSTDSTQLHDVRYQIANSIIALGQALSCLEQEWECAQNVRQMQPEMCDGQDNDCNASTVDGSGDARVGEPCDGEDNDQCLEGETICTNGQITCLEENKDALELCDNIDNDCNAATLDGTDETKINTPCMTSSNVSGTWICQNGEFVCGESPNNNIGTIVGGCNCFAASTSHPLLGLVALLFILRRRRQTVVYKCSRTHYTSGTNPNPENQL